VFVPALAARYRILGGGYYGTIVGDDGSSRYFNLSYTEFCPSNRGVYLGERVLYAPITEPGTG
jgi:hypothetical protein